MHHSGALSLRFEEFLQLRFPHSGIPSFSCAIRKFHHFRPAARDGARGSRPDLAHPPAVYAGALPAGTGAWPVPAHHHAGERPSARGCAAGLALLTMRAAGGAAKVNRCRETAR